MSTIIPQPAGSSDPGEARHQLEAYVYVLEFRSGLIKVGYSNSPAKRIRQHRDTAMSLDNPVVGEWVSPPHTGALSNEKELIRYCSKGAASIAGREYFKGLLFAEVAMFAESLSFGRATPQEIKDFDARVAATSAHLRESLRPVLEGRIMRLPPQLDVDSIATVWQPGSEQESDRMADALCELLHVEPTDLPLPDDLSILVMKHMAAHANLLADSEFFQREYERAHEAHQRFLREQLPALRHEIHLELDVRYAEEDR